MIFLLPRGGNEVVLAQTGNTVSVMDNRLKKEWKLRFGVQNSSDPITVKRVFETLRGSNDSGDEFKKRFVLFSVSSFLAPTSNKTIDLKLVRVVANVESIGAYDWCAYIFREMVNSIKVFKQGGKSIVSGCILVVMLVYFHRFNFKGDVMGHTLPLISHWDDEKLPIRVQVEKKTGSLCNAPLSKIDCPISLQQQDKPEAVRGTQNSDKGLDEELEEQVDEERESKEGYLMVKLQKGVESDIQIKAPSIDVSSRYLWFFSYKKFKICGAHEIYLRMKRDNELFFSRYVNNMNKVGKMKPTKRNDEPSTFVHDEATEDSAAEEVVVNNEENPSAKQAPTPAPAPSLSQTQPALRDPDYHTFIDGLVAWSYEKEKAKRGLPSFDIWTDMLKIQYKELNKKYGGCFDRDLLSDDDLECADEENDEEFEVTNLNSDDGGEAEKRNDEEECFDDFVTKIVLGVTSHIEHMYEDTNVVNKKDDVESNVNLGVTGTAEDNLSDPNVVSNVDFGENVLDEGNQNRDFDDGKPDDSNISAQRFISQYLLQSNVIPASADCCREDDRYKINHDDDDDDEMKKYRAEVFSTWDMWSGIYDEPLNLNAEMVFVPLLYEQHYFCVCIDFVREKLFYLDNRCYDDFNETVFAYVTDVVANTYPEYLVSKGTENAEKVNEFMMINVPFDWQTREQDLDCGVFMMFFYGDIFDCELYNVQKRDLYRGEVAAILILSDLNGNRSEVMERVTRHNEMKDMVEDGSASVVGSSRRGKLDELGCTFNCGMADDKVLLVSKFMRAIQAHFAKMFCARKEVLDYCLLDDHNLSLEYDFSTSLIGLKKL
ncbi:hypothetical protein KSS87_018541 [Heliosperma pusillum]|nr:hypothetical protein KSS87_018541 [Heliosperma pusillum]